MQIDTEDLRKHYSSLSDEGLLAINREDLTDVAQNCYDAELNERKLTKQRGPIEVDAPEETETEHIDDDEDAPDWQAEAAEVFSWTGAAGTAPAQEMAHTREVIEAAGIPCLLQLVEEPEEKPRWRIVVPGSLSLHAMSILDRDIFNDQFEAEWRTHLETLSDSQVRLMTPQTVFCGLFDRVERATRVYDEELTRRKAQEESA
jgi:hypothetical protein